MIGGAAAFGALGLSGAREQNRAIEQNALAQQRAANENINRARFAFFDQRRAATSAYQRAQGNASAAIFAGARSGHSLNRLLAQQDNDFFKDDLARKRGLAHTIENLETQKRNIARQASAQTSSEGLAFLGGAIQGASLGASVGGAIDGAISSVQDSAYLADLEAGVAAGDQQALLETQALSRGASPSFLRQFPGVATQGLSAINSLQSLQQQSSLSTLQFQQQSAGLNAAFAAFMNQNALGQLQGLQGPPAPTPFIGPLQGVGQ